MSKLKVDVHYLKLVHFSNKNVGKTIADKVENFAYENGFELVVDIRRYDNHCLRFELDRGSVNTPFIVIREEDGKYNVGGKIGNKHADLFLEEFCNE